MKCPSCEHEFRLSWLMYWKSPFGRHSCPKCQSKLRMRHTFRYYLSLVVLAILFAFIPSVVASELGVNGIAVLLIYIGGIAVVFYFDKLIDDTWRGTVERK